MNGDMVRSMCIIHLKPSGGFEERREKQRMTGFFEDLKRIISEKAEVVTKKTGEVVDVVAKKTEQTVEIQKIKSQIHVMERNNDRDYKDIGKIVYEKFRNGQGADEQYIELGDAIAEREDSIANAKEEIAKLRGLDVCPECEAHIEPEATFCPKCGTKVDGDSSAEDIETAFEE